MKSVLLLIAIVGLASAYETQSPMPGFYHEALYNNLEIVKSVYPRDFQVSHIASRKVLATLS